MVFDPQREDRIDDIEQIIEILGYLRAAEQAGADTDLSTIYLTNLRLTLKKHLDISEYSWRKLNDKE